METRIYQKSQRVSVLKILKESLHDIYSSRFLAKQLTVRDLKAQYRQSYFGILWLFITPLTTAFVWIFLSKSGAVQLADTGGPYPVYAFTGTLMWSIMKEAINTPGTSTGAGRGIMSKINFPKEALVVSGIYKMLFNTLAKIGLLIILLLVYKVPLQWGLLLFPLGLLAVVLFGTTIGLIITPISMLYKDVGGVISLALSFIMYITPVVYVVPDSGIMKTLMDWNPLTPLIQVSRDLIIGGDFAYLTHYFILLGCTIPFSFLGLVWYRVSIPIIVERMSA